MKPTPLKHSMLLFTALVPMLLNAQAGAADTSNIKNGIFHSYPKNTSDHFITERNNNIQKETNVSNGDTVIYSVKWTNDYVYSLKYLSGGKKLSADVKDFLSNHLLVYKIEKSTEDYYIFSGYADKVSNAFLVRDTMWMHERIGSPNSETFQQIKNMAVLRRGHFSDTSKYAVLYLYRPGKLTNSRGNYIIYFDDNAMCVAKNNSGYVFKILKEGSYKLKSKLNKDESIIQLDVQFGKKYYVKSMIHWGFYNFRNYKLEMLQVKPETGENEFYEVNLQ